MFNRKPANTFAWQTYWRASEDTTKMTSKDHEMRSPTRDDEKNDAYFYPSIEQQVARERADATVSGCIRQQARPSGKPKVEDDSGHDAEEGTTVPKL